MAKKKKPRKTLVATPKPTPQLDTSKLYEGDRLNDLLANLKRSVEVAKELKREQLPEKMWIKQQFAIGVNDVTRVLARMPPVDTGDRYDKGCVDDCRRRAPLVPLQAVIVASDCNPRSLTKHIPSLASSRNVSVIYIRDSKGGSLRLGELVNLRTAIAIGVKVTGSSINSTVGDELLSSFSPVSIAKMEKD